MKHLFFILLFLVPILTMGQKDGEVSLKKRHRVIFGIGVGYPELVHFRSGYTFEQFSFGITAGFIPGSSNQNLSFTAFGKFNFAGKSKLSNKMPWFFRPGLSYHHEENDSNLWQFSYLFGRFGREINLSKSLAFEFDLGLMILTYYSKTSKEEGFIEDDESSQMPPFFPSINLGLIYRL